jgi:hypothetical protein
VARRLHAPRNALALGEQASRLIALVVIAALDSLRPERPRASDESPPDLTVLSLEDLMQGRLTSASKEEEDWSRAPGRRTSSSRSSTKTSGAAAASALRSSHPPGPRIAGA